MERKIFGLALILCAAALVWSDSPESLSSSWGPAGGASVTGSSGLGLVGKLWSRTAPSAKARPSEREHADFRPAALGDPLRDALSGEASDPAEGFWARAFARDLRSARADPSRPGASAVSTPAPPAFRAVHRTSQPSKRPFQWLPTVQTPPLVAANRPDAVYHPRHPERQQEERSSNSGQPAASTRTRATFDGRGGTGRLSRPSVTAVPSWSPAEGKRTPAEKAGKPPKPPTLNDWLGRGALKAPRQRLNAPSFTPLRALFPERLPDGRPYDRASPPPAVAEGLVPPDERPLYEDWLYADERRGRGSKAHWHQDGAAWLFHAGKAWGSPKDGRWSWLLDFERRWWTVADGAQRLVRHDGAWWWRTSDGWFLLKDGEPWAWRRFPEWEGHGYIHPTRGTQVVYSADGSRLAVMTPGSETVVFDCATGEVLGRYPPTARPADALAPTLEN